MRAAEASIAALVFTLFTLPVLAADCAPQTLITTLDLEPAIERREEFVPVTIQGVHKLMLLDTGGAMTEITIEAANELHLQPRRGNFRLYNMYGDYSDQVASGSLAVGPLKANDVALAIAPGEHLFGEDYEIAGVLAPDILKHYDLDIDFGSDKMRLFSPDHCAGKVVYWKADTVAVVPMRVLRSGQIIVPVLLDGKRVSALLDTGAYNTTLSVPVAESQYGLKLGSADAPHAGHLLGLPNALTYRRTFSTLAFDGIVVKNPQIQIIPDLLHQVVIDAMQPPTGSRIRDPKKLEGDTSMLLGMNILSQLHIYIAYREQRLYVTTTDVKPVLPPTAEEPPSNNHRIRVAR